MTDYCDKPLHERQSHLRPPPETDCDYNWPKKLEHTTQQIKLPNLLTEYLGIEKPKYIAKTGRLHHMDCAHICGNGWSSIRKGYSSAPEVCRNPEHLYFATRTENHRDTISHGTQMGRAAGYKRPIEDNIKMSISHKKVAYRSMMNNPIRKPVIVTMMDGHVFEAESAQHAGRILTGDKHVSKESKSMAAVISYCARSGTGSTKWGVASVEYRDQ